MEYLVKHHLVDPVLTDQLYSQFPSINESKLNRGMDYLVDHHLVDPVLIDQLYNLSHSQALSVSLSLIPSSRSISKYACVHMYKYMYFA